MDIEMLNLFPALIVVSIERENEFEQERENESSENAKENRTSWREEPRQLTVLPTRPSALGMSDQIWGPLIHIFVDEKKIEKDKDLDQVNCEYTALRFLNF